MTRGRSRGSLASAAAGAILALGALGGCTVVTTTPPGGSSSGPVSDEQTAADAAAAITAVGKLPGVASTSLSFSRAKLGYASSIAGTVAVAPGADPVDVLERVLFELYRGVRVGTYVVATTRDGQMWDTENLGLSSMVSRAALVSRYGEGQAAATLPTTLPPRPAPTSRPIPGTPATP